MAATEFLAIPRTGRHRGTVGAVPRRFRPDIQGLRAIAVLTVALYHAGVPFLRGGYVGVDVFFVISGFLITRQLFEEASVRGRVYIVKFYAQRFRRLLPPVVLVVSCTLAVAHYVLPFNQLKSLIKDAYYTSFYGINYHLAEEGVHYQAASVPPSALQHFWSLAVEEQFYLFWPLLIMVCAAVGRRRFRKALTLGVIGALTLATLYLSIAISSSESSTAYFSLQTRAWELGAGAIVALTADRWARLAPSVTRALAWAGLGAILTTAVFYSSTTVYPGWAASIPVAGAALLIAAGMQRQSHTPESALLERPFMQYGGKVSYAWYLWHWPMLILLPSWVGRPLTVWENVEIVCLAFWFAVMTYFLENAAHRSSWSPRKWAQAGVGLSSCVALAAVISTATLPSLVGKGGVARTLALTHADLTVVQDSIKTSLGTQAVPSNLTPSLASAATDTPSEPGRTCHATLLMTKSEECVYGALDAPLSRTAVLVGDSHADQWISALAQDATEQKWKIVQLTKSACPIADMPTYEQDLKRNYTECTIFRKYVEEEVAKIKPSLIIGSEANVLADDKVTAHTWADSTLQELKKLAGQTSKISYIGDSPTTKTDTVTCLASHLDDARKCAYSPTSDLLYVDRYIALTEKLTGAGVGYVDTSTFFCTLTQCPAVVNNLLVHRDQGHVTNSYAMWLRPMLNPIFQGA